MEDFLPNDGANYDPSSVIPEEQEREEREIEAKANSSFPVLDDLIADFKKDILSADSISGLNTYQLAEQTPQQAQIALLAHQKYVEKLKEKLNYLEDMRAKVKR